MAEPIKTLKEWDAELKAESLHHKFDYQLVDMEKMLTAKIPHVLKDLNDILRFPDAKRKETYESLFEAGEITSDAITLPQADKDKIDAELQHELNFYQTKWERLSYVASLIPKEQEIREKKLVARSPIGTTYYVDFVNGHDVDNDGTSATKTNGDGPWATLDKATATLTAGNKVIVRRGMTQTVSATLDFTNDGTIVAPIIMEADFDNITWTGATQDETTAGQTATLIFGTKTVTFAGDISGDISVGDWIYETTEDNRKFAYEVASITGGSNEIVTLFLPYKGAISGAGKTIKIMPPNPIWNTAAGNYRVNLDIDFYWQFQGLHFRGTAGSGVVEMDGCDGHIFKDCILEGNGVNDYALSFSDERGFALVSKSRFYNYYHGIRHSGAVGSSRLILKDCLLDGNNTANSLGIYESHAGLWQFYDCEFKRHAQGDIGLSVYGMARRAYRNCLFSSTIKFAAHQTLEFVENYVEDFDQVIGDNRQLTYFSTAEGTPSIQSDTTDVRGGGGTTSIKVTPSDKLATAWELSKILLFEYPIYANTDSKTYTVYFKSDDDTDWDADPTNAELWIEAEYWGHATNVQRIIKKSTGVCNNFDADDTVWDTLTVTAQPGQTGVLYLRGYYCKTKEGGKSNIFFCDTKIGIA